MNFFLLGKKNLVILLTATRHGGETIESAEKNVITCTLTKV